MGKPVRVAFLSLLLLAAAPGTAWADGPSCPPRDAFDDSIIPGCPSAVVDPLAPIDDGAPDDTTAAPAVDYPDGDSTSPMAHLHIQANIED